MTKYELAVVLPGSLEKEAEETLSKRIKAILKETNAVIEKETAWGIRQLAYPVKKEQTGNYFFWELTIPKDKIKELNRLLGFETKLLRTMLLTVTASSHVVPLSE